MKITDKNIDVKNARYWSALNDKNLIAILKDICKKSKGKKQLNEKIQQLNEFEFVTTTIIVCTIIGLIADVGIAWYASSKSQDQQKQADKDTLDQQKFDSYKNSGEMVANPDTFKFDHSELVDVVHNIIAPTGSTVNVNVKDQETGEVQTHVADEYKVVDRRVETVVRNVYVLLKNNKGGTNPTEAEVMKAMDDLKNGKLFLTTVAPQAGIDWQDFAVNAKLVDAEKYKSQYGITDIKTQCRLMSFDRDLCAWTTNGVVIAKMSDPDNAIATATNVANQQLLQQNPALKNTSSSKWPWILGIAAAVIGIPLLWSCLSKVTKEVKTNKLLAKCEFTCTGSNMTYCFGFNLMQMKWTLASKDNQKISSEETSSFAKTEFAKKFADAVEIQMKNFYSENGSKLVYKAVEVAGKDKAELIKLLYDNKDKIESSLYNMTKCEAA